MFKVNNKNTKSFRKTTNCDMKGGGVKNIFVTLNGFLMEKNLIKALALLQA